MTEKDAAEKPKTIDFGAPDRFGAHVFRVDIPSVRTRMVRIVELYGYRGGENGIPVEEERVLMSWAAWSGIAEAARKDFNDRLKARGASSGRWRAGSTHVDRLLGKELCVLAWAAERAKAEEIPVICTRWAALRPEERWWLFAMTVAEAGLPEDYDRGWRRALYAALSDGRSADERKRRLRPVEEMPPLPLFLAES